jgi:hypothetical protein
LFVEYDEPFERLFQSCRELMIKKKVFTSKIAKNDRRMAEPPPAVPRSKSAFGKLKKGLKSLFGGKASASDAVELERDATMVPVSRLTVVEANPDSDVPGAVYMSPATMMMGGFGAGASAFPSERTPVCVICALIHLFQQH